MNADNLLRRRLVAAAVSLPALAALDGCVSPLPVPSREDSGDLARELLAQSAAAHGLEALSTIHDVSVSYEGSWRGLINRLQPALVDAGFRGRSEERLLLRERLTAQNHVGPQGAKHVVRRAGLSDAGDVSVWFNGRAAGDDERRAAAALVVDGYGLFLLGPLLLTQDWMLRRTLLTIAAPQTIRMGHRRVDCDVLRVRSAPGLGFSAGDDFAVYIDRADRFMRRVRFSLNGLESTRGAVAEVDTDEHVNLHGVRWPTRFHEALLRPLPLPVHDWRLTGLDLNRGLTESDLRGAEFGHRAAVPAGSLRP
ncbi:MAG: hypothetical protein M3O06_09650 [Pseudomonadota bacterium]|nr:hypothetical protein [Pseudomonadota bacterium]